MIKSVTKMQLLTKAIEAKLRETGRDEETPLREREVLVKFFDPCGAWTWYAVEGEETDDGDWMFYGLVIGHETEAGYFSLRELARVKGARGIGIERDRHFAGCIPTDELPSWARATAR